MTKSNDVTKKQTRLSAKRYGKFFFDSHKKFLYYRKRGSASYIVREVLSVRERERDTDRERERQRETEVTSPLSR